MKLQEYQSKRLFAKYGVPIPDGDVATSASEAREIASRLGGTVVVKSQVLVGGRGKAGGVKLAKTPAEAASVADQILGMDIKGLTVHKVLVDQAADIAQEIYLGVVLDRGARRVALMASAAGGMDIEEVAATTPEKIITVRVDPAVGFQDYQARQLAFGIELDTSLIRSFTAIAHQLLDCSIASDASLAEINPLVVTGDGDLLAVDGKVVLDDSALFRHPDLAAQRDAGEESEAEADARRYGLSYVDLDGEIGCMVNGAGLAMATMDVIKLYGAEPANFLDIGGGAQAEKVTAALRIILAEPKVKAVLFNIFGGITRCDEVAKGILTAMEQIDTDVPMITRLVGTNQEEGRAILADAQMITAGSLAEGAQKAVAAARGEV